MAVGMKCDQAFSTKDQPAAMFRAKRSSPVSFSARVQIQMAARVPWKSRSSDPAQGGTLPGSCPLEICRDASRSPARASRSAAVVASARRVDSRLALGM
jgi:hypothetical protein